jgi:hypothetical protein
MEHCYWIYFEYGLVQFSVHKYSTIKGKIAGEQKQFEVWVLTQHHNAISSIHLYITEVLVQQPNGQLQGQQKKIYENRLTSHKFDN